MSDGVYKIIERIKFGDKVMSRDEATGETSIQRVVQTFKKRANRLVKLRFSNGENIEATEEHPFYVPKRGFTAAKLLKVGALVATLSGPAAKVEAVSIVEKSVPVYNFEVENTHTYFVGKSRLWVHNLCFVGPNKKRHFLSAIRKASDIVNKEKTTLVHPAFDAAVNAEVADIIAGRIVNTGDEFVTASGRVYGHHPNLTDVTKPHTLYPKSGPGLIAAERADVAAFRIILQNQGDLTRAKQILDTVGYSSASQQKGFEIFGIWKAHR